MTAITALRRQLDAPPKSTRTQVAAAALVEDARAIAEEWSQGSDLGMVSRQAAAERNAVSIVLTAAASMVDIEMAALIRAYMAGDAAGHDFAAYDRNLRLDRAAEAVRGHAEAVADAFIEEMTE